MWTKVQENRTKRSCYDLKLFCCQMWGKEHLKVPRMLLSPKYVCNVANINLKWARRKCIFWCEGKRKCCSELLSSFHCRLHCIVCCLLTAFYMGLLDAWLAIKLQLKDKVSSLVLVSVKQHLCLWLYFYRNQLLFKLYLQSVATGSCCVVSHYNLLATVLTI